MPVIELSSSCLPPVHINVHTCRYTQNINAASHGRAGPDARLGRLTEHVRQTLIVHHHNQSLYLFFCSCPLSEIPVNMFVLGKSVGRRREPGGGKRLIKKSVLTDLSQQEQISIAWLNVLVIKLRGGGGGGRGGGGSVSSWVHEDMGVYVCVIRYTVCWSLWLQGEPTAVHHHHHHHQPQTGGSSYKHEIISSFS